MIVCALVLFEFQELILKLRDALRLGCVRFRGVVVEIAFAVDVLPLWTITVGACPGGDPRRTGWNRAKSLRPFVWPKYREEGPPDYVQKHLLGHDLTGGTTKLDHSTRSILEMMTIGYRHLS